MDLGAYLDRLGYRGPVEPTVQVLTALHRSHLCRIAYEDLDIHLGRPLTLDADAAFDKLVRQRRGGWCFEMNGLLCEALRAVGFDAHLGTGSVFRPGDHALVIVGLPGGDWLADVGFGNGLFDPIPLREGLHQQHGRHYRLRRESNGEWTFVNDPVFGPGFRFAPNPTCLRDFAAVNEWLQTSPESGFVRTVVCHRFDEEGRAFTLRDAVLRTVTLRDRDDTILRSAEHFATTVSEVFGIDVPEVASLWPAVSSRHDAWSRRQATR